MEEFSDEERSDLVESQPSRASARSYPGPAVPALPADYALGARHTSVVHAAAAALHVTTSADGNAEVNEVDGKLAGRILAAIMSIMSTTKR